MKKKLKSNLKLININSNFFTKKCQMNLSERTAKIMLIVVLAIIALGIFFSKVSFFMDLVGM